MSKNMGKHNDVHQGAIGRFQFCHKSVVLFIPPFTCDVKALFI